MEDELIDPTIGVIFPTDHNPNYILMNQARDFWDSIPAEQHMLEHEIMMRNIEELAKEDLERELS